MKLLRVLSVVVLALVLPLLSVSPARARDEGGLELRPELTTDLPVQSGVALVAELPWRLRLDTGLGLLPGSYVQLINTVVMELSPAYTQQTADLVESALQDSLVWRTHLGWRPLRGHGFWFAAGYTLVALGGGASAAELVSALTGQALPEEESGPRRSAGSQRTFSAESRLHMLDLALGWEWAPWRELTVRTGLGWSWTFTASTDLEPDFEVRGTRARTALEELEKEGEEYLDGEYTAYVHPPWITLALGWRF